MQRSISRLGAKYNPIQSLYLLRAVNKQSRDKDHKSGTPIAMIGERHRVMSGIFVSAFTPLAHWQPLNTSSLLPIIDYDYLHHPYPPTADARSQ